MYHIFIHLPTEEHLACFCNLAIVSNSQLAQWWVRSLGQEEPLEKGMATHFSILTRRIPWTEEPSVLQSMGLQRIRHDWADMHAHANILIVNNTALNIGLQTSLWYLVLISFWHIPRYEIVGSYFNFLRNLHTVFHSGYTQYFPSNSAQWFPFLYFFAKTCYTLLSWVEHALLRNGSNLIFFSSIYMHRTLQSALQKMLLSNIYMSEQGLKYSKIKLQYFKKG